MDALISMNGRIIDVNDAGVSVDNAGLLHGCGVFTTLRIYNGKPFLFDAHWQRLEHNASMVGIDHTWQGAQVIEQLHALIAANKLVEGKARISLLQSESR